MERNRVYITDLTEQEAKNFRHFDVGKECRISAGTPHFIVQQGRRRVAGIVIGMNSRPETRRYSHNVKYVPSSPESVICYYDL